MIPAELRERAQWVIYADEIHGGRRTKVPYSPEGYRASVTRPASWMTYADAARVAERAWLGIGFVFTADDPYVGVDLDHVVTDGELEPWALQIVRGIDSYTEYSPSGTGVHVIARGLLPPAGRRRGSVEMYDSGRFFTMTGKHVAGTPMTIELRDAAIAAVHAAHVAVPEPPPDLSTNAPAGPAGYPRMDLDDDELVRRMFAASNGRSIATLWSGNLDRHGDDKSVADLALCAHLAFWTGGDPAQKHVLPAAGVAIPLPLFNSNGGAAAVDLGVDGVRGHHH